MGRLVWCLRGGVHSFTSLGWVQFLRMSAITYSDIHLRMAIKSLLWHHRQTLILNFVLTTAIENSFQFPVHSSN